MSTRSRAPFGRHLVLVGLAALAGGTLLGLGVGLLTRRPPLSAERGAPSRRVTGS